MFNKRIHWSIDLLEFYFRRKLLRQKIPLLASFKLTYRCNLRCGGCPFHQKSHEDNSHISWNEAIRKLQELKNKGCHIIVFEGGEPFLWKEGSHDFRDLVVYAKKYFFRVAVTTNGTFPLDVPADIVWVSLDGLKDTHNTLRSNSFDRIWANLLSTNHPKVFIHFTINKKNWQDLEPFVKKIKEVPAIKGLTVQLFYPYGQGEEPLMLSFPERKAALQKVIALKDQGYPILNSKNTLRAMIENNWTCHDDILINVDPDGMVTSGCYVKSRGKIYCAHCGFTPIAEASGALDLKPGSILAGWQTFIKS